MHYTEYMLRKPKLPRSIIDIDQIERYLAAMERYKFLKKQDKIAKNHYVKSSHTVEKTSGSSGKRLDNNH